MAQENTELRKKLRELRAELSNKTIQLTQQEGENFIFILLVQLQLQSKFFVLSQHGIRCGNMLFSSN